MELPKSPVTFCLRRHRPPSRPACLVKETRAKIAPGCCRIDSFSCAAAYPTFLKETWLQHQHQHHHHHRGTSSFTASSATRALPAAAAAAPPHWTPEEGGDCDESESERLICSRGAKKRAIGEIRVSCSSYSGLQRSTVGVGHARSGAMAM